MLKSRRVCKEQLNDSIRKYFNRKPSCYSVEQLILSSIQFLVISHRQYFKLSSSLYSREYFFQQPQLYSATDKFVRSTS